jgi:hypothetical protein
MQLPNITWLRDDFRTSTWLLTGACLQSILLLFLPIRVVIFPIALILGLRIFTGAAMSQGFIHNPGADGVRYGSSTVIMPNDDGSIPAQFSEKGVVLLILGARSSQYV